MSLGAAPVPSISLTASTRHRQTPGVHRQFDTPTWMDGGHGEGGGDENPAFSCIGLLEDMHAWVVSLIFVLLVLVV